jgi:hypothetical protein
MARAHRVETEMCPSKPGSVASSGVTQEHEPVHPGPGPGGLAEPPAPTVTFPVDVGHGHDLIDTAQRDLKRDPLRPGTESAGVQVIATRLGTEAAGAVSRYATSEPVEASGVARLPDDAVIAERHSIDGAGIQRIVHTVLAS